MGRTNKQSSTLAAALKTQHEAATKRARADTTSSPAAAASATATGPTAVEDDADAGTTDLEQDIKRAKV